MDRMDKYQRFMRFYETGKRDKELEKAMWAGGIGIRPSMWKAYAKKYSERQASSTAVSPNRAGDKS